MNIELNDLLGSSDNDQSNEISAKYKDLKSRIDKLTAAKNKIDAVVQMKRKQRDEIIEKIKQLGYNPDKLDEQIKEKKRVLMLKLENIEKEVSVLEERIEPMLEAIK